MRYLTSSFLIFFIILFVPVTHTFSDLKQQPDSYKELRLFLVTLVDSGYNILNNDNLSEVQSVREIKKLLKANLNLEWMAKYSLGRNRRALKNHKIKEFIKVYSDFVVNSYASLVKNYSGQKLNIKNIRKMDEKLYMVNTIVETPGATSPTRVDYLIHQVAGHDKFKVSDIITEGGSLLRSQQAEFNTIIMNQGIDALIQELQKIIDSYKNHDNAIGR